MRSVHATGLPGCSAAAGARGIGVRCSCGYHHALLSHINLRNHRKILVVDGVVGFTGA